MTNYQSNLYSFPLMSSIKERREFLTISSRLFCELQVGQSVTVRLEDTIRFMKTSNYLLSLCKNCLLEILSILRILIIYRRRGEENSWREIIAKLVGWSARMEEVIVGGVPVESLTGELAGVWSGWRASGDREVVREASAKGLHINLAYKFLTHRRGCSLDEAKSYFSSEVDIWINELLNKRQVHKASHILKNVASCFYFFIFSIVQEILFSSKFTGITDSLFFKKFSRLLNDIFSKSNSIKIENPN